MKRPSLNLRYLKKSVLFFLRNVLMKEKTFLISHSSLIKKFFDALDDLFLFVLF